MDNDKLLNFVSRFVIIVPIVVIIFALILKPVQKNYKKEMITITPSIQIKSKGLNLSKIDLNGEYICNFKTKEATQTAYIKNKKIFIVSTNDKKKETGNFLFSGDCLYNWDKGEYSGEKICGLSSYVSTAEKLLNTGLIDINTIINSFKGTDNILKNGSTDFSLKDLVCKEKIIQKNISFDPPKNILFKNKKIK